MKALACSGQAWIFRIIQITDMCSLPGVPPFSRCCSPAPVGMARTAMELHSPDFAGPFLNSIIIDAHLKWIAAHVMHNITSAATLKLSELCSLHMNFHVRLSFVSEEFQSFLSQNGIVHVTSAPYHPSSNGLAERAVQTVRQGLKRTTGATIQEKLSRFLFTYRITPQTTTGIPPAMLLMGRRLRSRLDRLFPDLTTRVESKQLKQAEQHDTTKPLRKFSVGDTVYTKDFATTPPKWIPGKVTRVTGPLSYCVELASGKVVRRHVDAIRCRDARCEPTPELDSTDSADNVLFDPDSPAPPSPPTPPMASLPTLQPPMAPSARRSARHRLPPDRWGW